MLDAAVWAVGVSLVLADVLVPAGREVSAKYQVGQLQRRIVRMLAGQRLTAEAQGRLHRAGAVHQKHGTRLEGRQCRDPWLCRDAGPRTQHLLRNVEYS